MSLDDILIKSNYDIIKTMTCLGVSATKCLIVVDDEKKLLGTISDGDIRRGLINGLGVDSKIDQIYCRSPSVLIENQFNLNDVKKLLSKNKIDLIPVVSPENIVVDYYNWPKLSDGETNHFNKFEANVVIMAGGKGERLKPFTDILPKPLIPLNKKPLLVHIIEKFLPYGLKDFHVTLNYKSSIIKAFFEEEKREFALNYVDEEKPLGTAGSLIYLNNKFSGPFFVTNCDIIVNADYFKIYNYHISRNFDITIVASEKKHTVPYGVCLIDDDECLIRINEKPSEDYYINVGLYILNPMMINLIPKNISFHMTDLIELAKSKNFKIGVYKIGENDWIDTGQWEEYGKAVNLYDSR